MIRYLTVIMACLLALTLAACAEPASDSGAPAADDQAAQKPDDSGPAAPARPQQPHARAARKRRKNRIGTAAAMLRRIPRRADYSAASYARHYFGNWTTQGGCSTREDVLIDESRRGHESGCGVRRGIWLSPYDGRRVKNPSNLDIDHMVPLAEAWVSGARRWSAATRHRYANDLGYSGTLRAVTADSNRAKGDRDPAAWMPPRRIHRCKYIGTWIAVKYRWHLAADPAERRVLRRYVKLCGRKADVPKPRRAKVRITKRTHRRRHRKQRRHASGGRDHRYRTCAAAIAHGLGPYRRGVDREYRWYEDADDDGRVCER